MYPDETILDPTRSYVWFISGIEIRNIKGINTIIILWNNKDVDITVREFLRVIEKEFRTTRLYRMMIALGYDDKDQSKLPDVDSFLVKGLHMNAKPMKVWGGVSSEVMEWKINYDTIKPISYDASIEISDEEVKRLMQLVARQPNHKEALVKVATIHPDWVKTYLSLYDKGKITFSS